MPRRGRISIPGVPWHIIQRGNNRAPCFYHEDDYLIYLSTLKEQADKYGCQLHAYVLMTNHVHLLLTPESVDSASLMMKHLGQRYVQYINRTYKRTGTLWEGRFRSCIAQTERYVLTCYRYIELNPVRADMVERPEHYIWSSHRTNTGVEESDLLTPHEEYLRLGTTLQQRTENYCQLFIQQMKPEDLEKIRNSTNGNYVLGSRAFQREIEQMLGRRVSPGKSGRPAVSKP